MPKASMLRKTEMTDARREMGKAVEMLQNTTGLLLKEFADLLQRDERQVARWKTGEERVQADAIWAIPQFRMPWLVAMSRLSGYASVTTTVEFK